MKRDMDLIRDIMLKVEAHAQPLSIDDLLDIGREEKEVAYHLRLLLQADLIDAIDASHTGRDCYLSISLSWDGHEFLDAAREDSRWQQAKEIARKAGGVTLDVLKSVLTGLLTAQVQAMMR